MTSTLKRRVRASGLAAASALALTAASVFGLGSAAQADYVSPEELSWDATSDWFAGTSTGPETSEEADFTQCSVVFSEFGGWVEYNFPDDAMPTGTTEVTAMIQSFYANVTQGGGTLTVGIDRDLEGSDFGTADIYLEIPVGVHGIDLDDVVEIEDHPDLGLADDATLQDVLDALDATGDDFYIIWLGFFSDAAAEVQWLSFGSEMYWFGTDAEWYLNDPSCGTIVPDPEPTPDTEPTPDSNPAPKKPVRVDTGL